MYLKHLKLYNGQNAAYQTFVPYICSLLKSQKIAPELSIFKGLTIESLTLNFLPGGKKCQSISFCIIECKNEKVNSEISLPPFRVLWRAKIAFK